MIGRRLTAFFLACFALLASSRDGSAQARSLYQQTQFQGLEVGRLTGDVYYARMDDYVSAFMVTSEGIVLVEPIGTEMATWLKAEMEKRFNVPVRYVIYSHSHWDHASGGDVYAETARFIGQENMLKNIAMPPADTPLPQAARAQDRNNDGRIDKTEAGGAIQAQFQLYDADGDGELTGAEVTRGPIANVRPPDLTFTDTMNLYLGGKRVEIISRPTPHAAR
jgi:glyoxylase-like metal-dependent hydrolase (beta-lactamase superfamily II)